RWLIASTRFLINYTADLRYFSDYHAAPSLPFPRARAAGDQAEGPGPLTSVARVPGSREDRATGKGIAHEAGFEGSRPRRRGRFGGGRRAACRLDPHRPGSRTRRS